MQNQTLIQRTSVGIQGMIRSLKSQKLFVASFVVAEATVKRIAEIKPNKISFVITGKYDGDEDLALAEYLEEKLQKQNEIDPTSFLERVIHSPTGLFPIFHLWFTGSYFFK